MNFNELIDQQKELGGNIEREIRNYGKDGKGRKTPEYLRNKLQVLSELWAQFDDLDSEIRTKHGDRLDHPYFKQGYYDQIMTGYDTIVDKINKLIAAHDDADENEQIYDATVDPKLQGTDQDHNLGTTAEVMESRLSDQKPSPHSRSTTGTIPKQAEYKQQRSLPTTGTVSGLINKYQFLATTLQKTLDDVQHNERTSSQQYFQLKIKAIEQHWDDLQQLHHKIWNQIDAPSAQGYNAEDYFALQDATESKLIYMYEKLNSYNTTTTTSSTVNTSTIKLPKVVLPKFDGDYLKWCQFRDLFTELVHKQNIADCHKMWYLKTSLQGDAERLIRHFTTSDANYAAAWEVITERFENKRLLVTALLNKLLSQPTMSTENATAIKQLHDTTKECLLGLQNLSLEIAHWDPLVLHLLLRKLDRTTHNLWEQSLKEPRSLSTIKDFLKFLEIRFQSLEALGNKTKTTEVPNRKHSLTKPFSSMIMTGSTCASCNGNHQLFACERFLQLTPTNRLSLVRRSKLCINCLKSGHTPQTCPSRGCTRCSRKHNTLLHLESSHTQMKENPTTKVSNSNNAAASLTTQAKTLNKSYVLLSTVLVNLTSDAGTSIECRAILDSGSQLNFITDKTVKRLGLVGATTQTHIEGIGQRKYKSQQRIEVVLQSKVNSFNTRIEANVLPCIISPQPTQDIDISSWNIPHNIALADPHFNKPQEIDLLLGAEIYHSILAVGQIRLNDALPIIQNTVFGWTVCGKIQNLASQYSTCGICSEDEQLSKQIEKFWHLEEVEHSNSSYTAAERQCENHFHQTHKRGTDGRFIVKLPTKQELSSLGDSKDVAYRRFIALERKLNSNEQLRQQYIYFMEEYERLGHMKEVDINHIKKPYYFLPHHGVLKPESSTTKLRVVFDASAKTTSHVSLNDILHTGPIIQDDVLSILLRFRLPRFAFTADIEKMYRQIRMDDHDQKLQLIWWRKNPNERLKCYQLTTVTYGFACAPYLAIKCLRQLSEVEAENFPLASRIIKENFYVDDVLSGSDSLVEAIEMQHQLQSLLQKGGFRLRKWCANHPRMLQEIPEEDRELQLNFNSNMEEHVKTMGLVWSPKTDAFRIRALAANSTRTTKRTVASDIAHLFDPLGIMGPIVIVAKLFSQKLWTLKIDWDASLPQADHTFWTKFKEELNLLNNITFPRHVVSRSTPKSVQIHIFTDASERAYGAAAYVRSVDKDNVITVRLLCAKSRVAPLKQHTLPRLELCAAKLGAELADRIKTILKVRREAFFMWTDSEITLARINATASSFDVFVRNRISSIQQLTIAEQWRHVPTKQNPADLLSRGTTAEKLISNNLWFYGPLFLHGTQSVWPPPYDKKDECMQEAGTTALPATATTNGSHFIEFINHKNSFQKLKRIIAYVLRFIHNTQKGKTKIRSDILIDTTELDKSLKVIIRTIQQTEFNEDLKKLKLYGEVAKNSSLASLAPFIDTENIIRVGGRLEASSLPFDAKHPMLLPYTHPITKLILSEIHQNHQHVGPQTLLAITRQQFWPIKGKTLARSIVQHCVQCARAKPKLMNQLMGNLPADRVQPARPFVNSGVDFCGPVWAHYKIRGKRPQKAYIAVFCCFSTKAVHLELVTDLSTEGFIGALKRFMARRGNCRHIYCDNATNFVGAKNQLQEIQEMLECQQSTDSIKSACSSTATEFIFIPPRSPHFGGLWEAAVKSAKHLLRSILAAASLTYEEMETIVIETEAILNSRPITPLSADPNDLAALTPGHFLVGEPLTSSIDTTAIPLKTSLLTRWKLVTSLKGEFWRRWHKEYLNQLQHRYKWNQCCQNIEPGLLVIIKEDNLPPMKWPMGRIKHVYKGKDGLVRVVDVRTVKGVFRRPIHRLAPLPIEDSDHANIKEDKEPTQTEYQITTPRTKAKRKDTSSDYDIETNQPITRPRSKKYRSSLGTAIVTTLLACMMLPLSNNSPVETVPFKTQPGIYFENLGPANVISSEWNLVAYYNMQPYWQEYQVLRNYSQQLEKVCRLITDKDICLPLLEQYRRLNEETTKTNELLIPISSNKQRRSKRGAINFVGHVANALFGVLDSDYADKMSTTIAKVQQNELHLSELVRNQTSLIDSTINIMKRNQEAVSKQFQDLENHVNLVTSKINGIEKELFQERLQQLFTSLAIQTLIISSNFHQTQNAILDVMIDTQHGKISPHLIAPDQLKREISTIKGHLPISLKLPMQVEDVLNFYNLMTIEGRIGTDNIIFRMKLPLLAAEELELFHVVPVPVKYNETFIAIQPSFPYLMLNLHRDQYYPLTESELHSCAAFNGQKYLCKQNHPMYRKGASVSECEVNFISQSKQSPSCQIVKKETAPHWIQLHDANQWIYSLNEKTTLNVVCGENVTQLSIENSGILKIEANCIIKQPLLTIKGHNLFPTYTKLSYTPTTNLSEFIVPDQVDPALRHIQHYQPHISELAELKKHLNNVRTQLPAQLDQHNIHHVTVSYLSLSLIVIMAIVLCWTWRAKLQGLIRKRAAANLPIHSQTRQEQPKAEDFTARFEEDG